MAGLDQHDARTALRLTSQPNVSVPPLIAFVTSQALYSFCVCGSGGRTGPTPRTVPLSDRRNTYWRAGSVDPAAA